MGSRDTDDHSHVLVLNTGGTIGMLQTDNGLDTYPGYLAGLLSTTSRFNDPAGESVYSHSRSVRAYRSWNASRSASPSRVASPREQGGHQSPVGGQDGLDEGAATVAYLSTGPVKVPTLVTPRTANGSRIRFSILEYPKLIDSSNMTATEFLALAADIERNYSRFSGFVILSGTDTLAYTASALSFLLENLGKSVVITGAQIPLSSLRNDAFENLLGALLLAGLTIAEVTVFFNQKLMRGNRIYKRSAFDFDAFHSPNHPPLAHFGIDLVVDWSLICRPTAIAPFKAHKQLCEDVGHLRFIPTMHERVLRAALAEPTKGLVIETYGNGNALEKPGWRAIIKEATDRGVVVVNVTQCATGFVKAAYAAGAWLNAAGAVSGLDMTTEAALAKLMYLLSKDLSPADVRALIMRPLHGELTADPPYAFVAAVDGPPPKVDQAARTDRVYGAVRPHLAPSISAGILAHTARLTAPQRLVELARTGSLADLAALLTDNPDADLDASGCLHAAVQADRADAVRILLAQGASVHARHEVSFARGDDLRLLVRATPLECAEKGSEVERLLLAAGAH